MVMRIQPLNTDLFQNELLYWSMNIIYSSIQYVMRLTRRFSRAVQRRRLQSIVIFFLLRFYIISKNYISLFLSFSLSIIISDNIPAAFEVNLLHLILFSCSPNPFNMVWQLAEPNLSINRFLNSDESSHAS